MWCCTGTTRNAQCTMHNAQTNDLHRPIPAQNLPASGIHDARSRSSKAFGVTAPMKRRPGSARAAPGPTAPCRAGCRRGRRAAPARQSAPGCRPRCSGGPHRRRASAASSARQHGQRDRHAHERTCRGRPGELARVPPDRGIVARRCRTSRVRRSTCCRAAHARRAPRGTPPRRSHIAGRLEVDRFEVEARALHRGHQRDSGREVGRIHAEGGVRLGGGEHLEGQLGEDAERPQLPTSAWCSRKPAAFFTTLPPLLLSRPRHRRCARR